MDNLSSLTDRLKLLADGTRLRLLSLLGQEELTVGELSSILGVGQSTISSQLARLRESRMVLDRREGTRCYYRMPKELFDADGRALWDLLVHELERDPLLQADRDRMEEVILARRTGAWVDRAAGSLDRRYVPGRSFESVAAGLATLLELGVCVDMGSGDGALLELLAPASKELICVDLHPHMIEVGQARAREGRLTHVRFVMGDMQDPPIEHQSADTVLFLQSLQYSVEPAQALQTAHRVLRPGGRCLVLTLGRHKETRIQKEYGHAHAGFTPAMLRKWLEAAGFANVTCRKAGYDHRNPGLPILVAVGVREDRA